MNRRRSVSAALALVAVVASVLIALLALERASGATRVGASSYETEFIDPTTLTALWLLFPVLGVAAHYSWRVAAVGLVGTVVPQWMAMEETVDRYQRSGWSSGLEVLGFAIPLGVLVLGILSILVGALAGRTGPQDQ